MNDAEDTEQQPDPTTEAPAKPPRRWRRLLLRWIPWVLSLFLLGAAVTFGLLWFDLKSEDDRRDEIRSAATDFVNALTNFSYETIEDDALEIRSYATGRFAEEAEVFFGERAIEAIQDAEAISEGDIRSIFIQDIGDSDEASAFAVVSETITNVSAEEPQTDILRMNIDLVLDDGRWKVENVEVLEAPGIAPLPAG